MAPSPSDIPSTTSSLTPYIVAAVILVLIGALLAVAILYLRPNVDPLVLIAAMVGFQATIFAAISAFLKSQETHKTVNSQLSAWKEEFSRMAHAEGMLQGTSDEQSRIAEEKRVALLTPQAQARPATPVEVVNTASVPVKIKE